MARIVIALGGNALGKTPLEQQEAVKNTASSIVDLIADGHEIVLAHGNGPQVGMINKAFADSISTLEMPFPECGAMSQGYIGYHLQNALGIELSSRGINRSVATVITQVVVNKDDPAFKNPSKPVGNFYSKEEADKLSRVEGYVMVEDAGRGFRRVVPSPRPVDIVEKKIIKDIVEGGNIVIACGGGGIPVIKEGYSFKGVPAVIDKDFASEKLAELVDADLFVILTAIEKVAINYNKENEEYLSEINIKMANKYMEEGHFAPGSMLPKVRAAVEFISGKRGRKTLITSLEKAKEGLAGKTGTLIS